MPDWKKYDYKRANYSEWVHSDGSLVTNFNWSEKLIISSVLFISVIGIGYYTYKISIIPKEKQ